jgi:hypothetical protein
MTTESCLDICFSLNWYQLPHRDAAAGLCSAMLGLGAILYLSWPLIGSYALHQPLILQGSGGKLFELVEKMRGVSKRY